MDKKKKDSSQGSRGPIKILSTSLGVALAANMLLTPGIYGESVASAAENEPTLVDWSSDAVKQYFNPSLDWRLPIPAAGAAEPSPSPSPNGTGASGGGSTAPVIIHQGGFGWDDLLLYHLLFNNGGSYSSSGWHRSHPVYDPRTNKSYTPKTYSAGAFENKQVPGTSVKPKTSVSSGTFNTKSSSSSGKSTAGTGSGSNNGSGSVSSSSSSSSSSGKSTSSSSGSIGGKSSGFSGSGGSSSSGS